MPAIVTQNFKARQVDAFLTELDANSAYMFIGNPYPWEDEFNPPMPVDNDGASFNIWDRIYGVIQIPASNYTKVIRRRNWVTDTVYDYYSTDMGPIAETNFYVMTANFQVYKCLWNNNGAVSTIEPTGTAPTLETADGYIWAYMYQIGTQDAQTFLTPEYMPVLIENQVQTNADNTAGQVTAVKVDTPGSGYLSINFIGGTAIDGDEAEAWAEVTGGEITAVHVVNGGNYSTLPTDVTATGADGAGATFTISTAGSAVTDVGVSNGGSGYVQPEIVKVAFSGELFEAIPITKNNQLHRVLVTNNGSGYTYLSLSVTGGTGGTVTPVLSPVEGHGFDAEIELGATNIMFSTTLAPADMEGFLPPSNRYRDVGIIINPGTYENPAVPYAMPVGTNIIKVKQVASTADVFQQNDLVSVTATGAQARVVYWDNTAGEVWLIRTLQENFIPFNPGDILTGTGKSIEILEVSTPDVAKYSGEIQYIETREPIQRTASQFEEIKIVIEF